MPDRSQAAPPDLAAGVALDRIPDGGLLAGVVGDDPVILTRSGDAVRAFAGKCTHLGAPLAEGLVVDGAVRCPWHHACFDLDSGRALAAPAFDALQAWTVERDGDTVRVGSPVAEPRGGSAAVIPTGPGMVIVGGGAAAYAAAVALRRTGADRPVTVISDDAHPPYDRTLLTKDYLDGKFGDDRLPIAAMTLADLGVELLTGVAVTAIDRAAKRVVLGDGRAVPYAKLLLATGAEPGRLDVPGADLPHVGVLRGLDDCRALLGRIDGAANVVVVGSSFIGLEAAASLRSRGLEVTVVTPETTPMAGKIGPELSRAIIDVHRAKGVQFRLGAAVARVENRAVRLEDGTVLPAGAVVVGVGVTPRTALAEAAGLAVDGGVVVDAHLRTSDPDIYAAGDIARWPDPHSGTAIRVEHWVVAERQGETAGANMAGGAKPFTDVPFFWSKHFDFSFRYMGHAAAWDAVRIEGDLSARNAAVRFTKDGRELAVATVGRDLQALEVARDMARNTG